jgi:hypothetical protein
MIPEPEFVDKIISSDRMLSFIEEHIVILCPHATVQIWEYEGFLTDMKDMLVAGDLLVV